MIQPELIVCVGGTALKAIYDQILEKKPPGVKISIEGGAKKVDGYHVATMIHPSWYDYWIRKWEWTEKEYLNDCRSILLQYSKK
jgi:uracil-DNA glycosylase